MTKHRIMLGVVFAALCVGCAGLRDTRLESHRQALASTYTDETRSMSVRMAAFDELLDTFTSGTREASLDRFVGWPVAQTKSRIDSIVLDDGTFLPGHTFSLHLVAPDGSDRWITMTEGKVQ